MSSPEKNKKVAVAMSGGVDSSVAAILLKEQGYEVFGLTMSHFDHDGPGESDAVRDARTVCQQLDMEHVVLDVRQSFKECVVNDFIREYMDGRTPNPCVMCNVKIKWGELLDYAVDLGADYIATGHYARVQQDPDSGRYFLKTSLNKAKDQSYALWQLNQAQLSKTLFPLGEFEKKNVRNLAVEKGLDVAFKAESQEICFIPDDNYQRYITEILDKEGQSINPGDILDQQGNKVGEHRGYPFYTIGQRKGLGVALGRPVYVTKIQPEENRIYIGDKEDLLVSGLIANQTNWISVKEPQPGMDIIARIRYNNPGYPAMIESVESNTVTIRFSEPRPAVTPGTISRVL